MPMGSLRWPTKRRAAAFSHELAEKPSEFVVSLGRSSEFGQQDVERREELSQLRRNARANGSTSSEEAP